MNSYKVQGMVVGLQKSKGDGNIEGVARTWDSTKAFVHQDLTDKRGNARGQSTITLKLGTSAEFDRLEKIILPCMFEFDFKKTTNGKGDTVDEVTAYRPLPTEVKSAKAA